ncbi:MAG: hypothetical protein O7A08_02155 [SAR324 cluster bacterium]|nr:hypothetical protein [SAR324 cluster bacterium]MCZ6627505.1 hypothetical protein [SAR324 cluster bacterium]MCZ6843812.1 hypothetical protein [SAR324 cluster bacterium]
MKHDKKIITEDQIRQALKNFAKRGGLIRKLPPQIASDRRLVGAQHAVYENLIEAVGLNLY